jgi:AraC-like DNA-binding protein
MGERPRARHAAPPPAIAESVINAVRQVLASLGVADTSGDPDDMFDRAARELGEPLVGIVVARRVPVGAYGLLEYGLRASATVGDALQRLARHYAAVSSRVRAELTLVEGRSALVFHRRPGARHSRHWVEMPAAAIANRLSDGAGHVPILHEVQFAHAQPSGANEASYVDAFGAPVRFRAPHDALVFLDGALLRPMGTGIESVANTVDAELRALEHADVGLPDAFQLRLRELIERGLTDGVTLASTARTLRLAPRTLQRLIAERGSSWSNELDEVRRARALRLLEAERKTTDIAAELGFRDASAFFRAFRRWTGTTPRAHARTE